MENNRFLLNSDYLEIITKEALGQIIKPKSEHKFAQAESSAEISILENLIENYEIEREFAVGKAIQDYDRRINYPTGSHLLFNGEIYKVIRSISGYKAPCDKQYWTESILIQHETKADMYSQFKTYCPGDLVCFNGIIFECVEENGYDFDNIRVPLSTCWNRIDLPEWSPVVHNIHEAFKFEGKSYMLYKIEGYDETIKPSLLPQCWGEIAVYDPLFNEYELIEYEYVIYNGTVYYPIMNVNADIVEVGKNIILNDPRNKNVLKHMVRLSLYELTKNISPNNVSSTRVSDYEASIKWLSDANKLKINPMIPRKVDSVGNQVNDWGVATFQKSYNPYLNPWQV